ncbi:type II toxin-antitoxin system RelE/ParE family toxin [Sphingomonas sp. RS2018]
MLPIRYAASARRDLDDIRDYFTVTDPGATLVVLARIVRAARILETPPFAGPKTLRGDRRKWRVPKTRYVIYYRVFDDHVRLLRIVHGARAVAVP